MVELYEIPLSLLTPKSPSPTETMIFELKMPPKYICKRWSSFLRGSVEKFIHGVIDATFYLFFRIISKVVFIFSIGLIF